MSISRSAQRTTSRPDTLLHVLVKILINKCNYWAVIKTKLSKGFVCLFVSASLVAVVYVPSKRTTCKCFAHTPYILLDQVVH
jgi:hypothetical protein